MADEKISAMPAASTLAGVDIFPGVQGGANVKITFTQTLTFIKSGLATVAVSGAYSDLTGTPSIPAGANPTATAGSSPVNGTATSFMRSDGAPAVPLGSTTVFGLLKADGTTITVSGGVISAVGGGGPAAANPTATAGSAAVNGTATTFMRSDAAPAVALASSTVFGLTKVDGTTITAAAGIISAVQPTGANPTATAASTAVNGVATTFMRSDGAPALPVGSASVAGIVKADGSTITAAAGVLSGTPATHPGYVVGNFYLTMPGTIGTGLAITANIAKFIPFIPEQNITISNLGVRILTIGTTNFQLAIYASDPTTKRPTGLSLSSTASTVNTSLASLAPALGSNVSLIGGKLYWLAICQGDSTAAYSAGSVLMSGMLVTFGSATEANVFPGSGIGLSYLSTPMTFGTWADVTSSTWTEGTNTSFAAIAFKVLSIP